MTPKKTSISSSQVSNMDLFDFSDEEELQQQFPNISIQKVINFVDLPASQSLLPLNQIQNKSHVQIPTSEEFVSLKLVPNSQKSLSSFTSRDASHTKVDPVFKSKVLQIAPNGDKTANKENGLMLVMPKKPSTNVLQKKKSVFFPSVPLVATPSSSKQSSSVVKKINNKKRKLVQDEDDYEKTFEELDSMMDQSSTVNFSHSNVSETTLDDIHKDIRKMRIKVNMTYNLVREKYEKEGDVPASLDEMGIPLSTTSELLELEEKLKDGQFYDNLLFHLNNKIAKSGTKEEKTDVALQNLMENDLFVDINFGAQRKNDPPGKIYASKLKIFTKFLADLIPTKQFKDLRSYVSNYADKARRRAKYSAKKHDPELDNLISYNEEDEADL